MRQRPGARSIRPARPDRRIPRRGAAAPAARGGAVGAAPGAAPGAAARRPRPLPLLAGVVFGWLALAGAPPPPAALADDAGAAASIHAAAGPAAAGAAVSASAAGLASDADSARAVGNDLPAGSLAVAGAPALLDTALTAAETEWFLVPHGAAQVQLAHAFVEPGTVRAEVGGQPWQAGADFVVAEREGIWLAQRALGAEGSEPVLVRIDYRFRPVPLPARRDLHPVVSAAPGGRAAAGGAGPPDGGPAGAGAAPGAAGAVGDSAAPGAVGAGALTGSGTGGAAAGALEIRGSKSVRLARGTNRELAVDQTLRLSIEGRLTPEIAVRAALSDDNLPVVPEGTTEELRDIDRVLVELEAARWRSTLGDFEAAREGSDFGDYRRKLQGLSLSARPGPARADLLAGSPRGAYRTVQIRGEEANQGPYRLGAGETVRDLFLVAGSERVTLDGERLTRGADRDYVIDYVRGTITFTYRRLITAESTIVVEFEEGEGAYARTVAGGSAGADFTLPLGGTPGAFLARITRERDDPQRLRSGELGSADQAALAAAGDDAALAVADGVALAPDGRGSYRRDDLGGQTVYVYDPAGGPYDLTFYYLGPGNGDYGVDSLTVAGTRVFGWRGSGNGSYRLGRPLPLPQSQSVATLAARLGPAERPRLRLEWDASRVDRNVLSGRDDGDNAGVGWSAHAASGEGAWRPGGLDLGRVALVFDHENRDSRFRPFQLRKDRFHYDLWGLAGRAQRDGFLEQRDVESRLAGRWAGGGERRRWELTGEWGRLSHGGDLAARRWSARGAWRWDAWDGASRWDEARSEDGRDPLDARRTRQRHEAGWSTRWLRPSVRWEREAWRDAAREDGPAAAGARRAIWGGRLEAAPGRAFRWLVGWERTLADSLRARAWARERDGRTATLQLAPPAWGGLRLTADGAWRRVRAGGGGEQTTRLAKVALAGAWPRLGSDWSLQYGIDNSRSEVLDRQVVFVGERQGDYDQNGDFVGRNLGDFNVIYAGTDSLVATTEVTGDLTWRQGFAWLGGPAATGRWSLLTQTAARGRSRAGAVGPLLRFAPAALFDPAQTVLGEVTLREELSLLALARGTDLRLRFEYDEALDRQYATHPEDRLRRLHQVATTHSLGERTTLQLRAQRQADRRATRAGGLGVDRGYRVDSWLGEAEGSWRPGAGNRVALAAQAMERRDGVSGIRQREWGLRPSARLLLDRRWSLQLDLRWAEVASEGPAGAPRPYFFPYPGANREAGARLAWEPSPQLSVSGVYFGRRQGERGWQHDVRIESTARF